MARTYATPAAVIVISVLFPSLGIVIVSLRLYSRNKARIKLWLDDWLTIAALVCQTLTVILEAKINVSSADGRIRCGRINDLGSCDEIPG